MDPFLGEITLFGGNFNIRGWEFCNGQLIAITQNTALFSLLGTYYGGDGRTTFALPDLRGRVPLHYGTGPGLSPKSIGQKSGQEKVVLQETQIPGHNHAALCYNDNGTTADPTGNVWAGQPALLPYRPATGSNNLNSFAIENSGGSLEHENRIPFQVVNYLIAMAGIFPTRV
jgi:microcystin-dependent protein